MPCLPHATADNPKMKMRTVVLTQSSTTLPELGTSRLLKYIICYTYHSMTHRMRISGFHVFEKTKLCWLVFFFTGRHCSIVESLEPGFRSHECFISDINSSYLQTSYSITRSLNWLTEIIFIPHGAVVKIKHNNVCVSFLVDITLCCRASQLAPKRTLEWCGDGECSGWTLQKLFCSRTGQLPEG